MKNKSTDVKRAPKNMNFGFYFDIKQIMERGCETADRFFSQYISNVKGLHNIFFGFKYIYPIFTYKRRIFSSLMFSKYSFINKGKDIFNLLLFLFNFGLKVRVYVYSFFSFAKTILCYHIAHKTLKKIIR